LPTPVVTLTLEPQIPTPTLIPVVKPSIYSNGSLLAETVYVFQSSVPPDLSLEVPIQTNKNKTISLVRIIVANVFDFLLPSTATIPSIILHNNRSWIKTAARRKNTAVESDNIKNPPAKTANIIPIIEI